MAIDWIKMRCDLRTHPKIVRMMSALSADSFRIIGGLHAVWSVFDAHSTDGKLDGYTVDLLDQVIGWSGLSAAMVSVGWLAIDAQAVVMPEFSEHNGKGAKRRAEDTKQKRIRRLSADGADSVREVSEEVADKERTRKEKKREEKDQELETSAAAPATAKKGSRLASTWEPSAEELAWAADNHPTVNAKHEAAKFRDYWLGASGKSASKLDWTATFRNWIRNAEKYANTGTKQASGDPLGWMDDKAFT